MSDKNNNPLPTFFPSLAPKITVTWEPAATKDPKPRRKWYEIHEELRDRWETENTLVNHRLSWLLVCQGLLFAAFGTLAGKAADACVSGKWEVFKKGSIEQLISLIRSAGSAFAVISLCGIGAAVGAQIILNVKYRKSCCKGRKHPELKFGVYWPITIIGFLTSLLIPAVFLVAWHHLSPSNFKICETASATFQTGGATPHTLR